MLTSRKFLIRNLLIPCTAIFILSNAFAAEPEPPDYNTKIAPLFRKYCNGCHNADDAEGGLVLEEYSRLLQGGKRGAAILPKSSQRSRLYLMLTGKLKPQMPPEDSEPPKANEIALIKAWIDSGAKGPSGAAPDPTLLISPKVKLRAKPRKTITAAAWSPDGKLIALAGYGTVRLISPETREVVRELGGHRGNVNSVWFSKDGKRLAAAAGEPGLFGEVRLWNVGDGKLVKTFTGHRDSLFAAVLSPDGKTLATSSYDEQIKIWDVADGKVRRTLQGHNGAVYDLAFSPDGRLLASAGDDRTVKLWDAAAGKRIDTFSDSSKEVYTLAFSPDGRHLAAGGVDNRIRVWRLSETAREGTNRLIHSRFAHQGPIIKLAWSQNGDALASASADRTLKIWDAKKLVERHLLPLQSDWTPALAFSPSGKRLVVGRMDGSFALYDVATAKVVPPPKPQLSGGPAPRGIRRGSPAKIKLRGKHLRIVKSVKISHPQISGRILPLGQDKPGEAWVEITAAAGVPLGGYDLSLVNEGGVSGSVKFYVDDLKQIVEQEPNDLPAKAAALSLPASVWGTIDRKGDVDHYAASAKAGQRVVFVLSASALGSKLNAVLTVLDSSGRVVAVSNDFDDGSDPLVAYKVPRDGVYTVRVNDLTLGASQDHFYRLSVGTFALVTGCYPLSVPANRQTELSLAGYNLPPGAKVTVKAGAAGELAVSLDTKQYRTRRGFSVLVSDAADMMEMEPNDQPAQATILSTPGAASGRIWPRANAEGGVQDVDLYKIKVEAGESWIIETQAARRGSPIDTTIEVLDASGKPIPRLLLQATRDSNITFRPIDSRSKEARVTHSSEMELNQYLYMQGEVVKLFRAPRGPDSAFMFYFVGGKRRCYFDTSSSAHALNEPCYIVQPRRLGAKLVPTGLPIFTLYYANDDEGQGKLGRDSRVTFTAPATGEYLIRVRDVRGLGGDRFSYRLLVRKPQPDFNISLGGANPTIQAGSGKEITFKADRLDGFEGEIQLEVAGLPPGFSVSGPITIEAGHRFASAVIYAAANAPQPNKENWSHAQVTAKAKIGDRWVAKPIGDLGRIKLAGKPKLLVYLEPAELTIRPGTTVTATLRIQRNGFKDRIRFNVNNLPHGVIVDNIGLSGVLIPAGQDKREIFITAAQWTPQTRRPFHAVAPVAGTQVSAPVVLIVEREKDE